ncbi:hypothetical protein GCM10009745_24430 [Kribbella yunnanensis]|uniref:Uncharacterized protein n=1 Tax=Kribbella yunnanensis TaxID=190194 RepID=A0ABP4SZA5_9ACTN
MTDSLVLDAARALLLPAAQRDAALLELHDWLALRADYGTDPTPAHDQAAYEAARRLEAGDETGHLWAAATESMYLRAATAELETATQEGDPDAAE